MICCCSLAGTMACKNCNNRYEPPIEQNFIYPYTERISNVPQDKKITLDDLLKNARPVKTEIYCNGCGHILMPYDNYCSVCGKKNDGGLNA